MSKSERIAALEQRVAELERIVAWPQVYRIEPATVPQYPVVVPSTWPTLDPNDGWPLQITVSTAMERDA